MTGISDNYDRRPLGEIRVARDERQRKHLEVDEAFLGSIKRLGVLHPIIVDRELNLIAGERRLEASRQLALPDIPIRYFDSLEPREQLIVELEENCKRLDLTWQDRVAATARIHWLYRSLDQKWTMDRTAEQLALNPRSGLVSRYVKIARHLDEERIKSARTFNEAEGILERREQRRDGEALEELLDPDFNLGGGDTDGNVDGDTVDNYSHPASGGLEDLGRHSDGAGPVEHADFLSWIQSYQGPKFNLIHCDFPYGIDHGTGPMALGLEERMYDDKPDIYWRLLEGLLDNLGRVMTLSGHLMFWYSSRDKIHRQTLDMFRQKAPDLIFANFPLIWHKSDNSGIAPDPKHDPRHVYETCLLATRGERNLVRITSDVYACPMDKRLHPSCKPEPMLRHFMTMLVDESSRVLDPTAGSGAALRAAESLGAQQILGLELDADLVQRVNLFHKSWRLLREAS